MGKMILNGVPYGVTPKETINMKPYSEITLWESANGLSVSSPTSVSLVDNINNYDALCIIHAAGAETTFRSSQIIPVSNIDKTGNTNFGIFDVGANNYYYAVLTYVDNTHITLSSWGSQYPIIYYKIIGIKYGGNLSPIIYSEEEREVGVWIDNKPLYAKSYITNNVGNENKYIDATKTPSNIQLVHSEYNYINNYFPNNQMGDILMDNVYARIGTNIYGLYVCLVGTSAPSSSSVDVVVTIYYTKTTDVAGSGSYNTLGVPTVHYSTDEQVIGTWTDGKPLYERSFFVDSPTANTTTIIQDASFSNIKYVVKTQGVYQRATSGYIIFDTIGSYENASYSSFCRVVKASPNASEVGLAYYIKIATGNTISNLCMTIQYTKTTD